MLLSGMSAGYQSPFILSIIGHITPHERIAPKRTDKLTRCEQIIPAPTYVRPKSKKNLGSKKHKVLGQMKLLLARN
jgi:hypothetical protein